MGEEGGGGAVPNRALKDYSIPNVGISSIQRPPIQANNFEIKPAIIQMIQNSVQFGGLPNDDPNLHIANFLEICDTFKHNGVTDDAVRLRLFPFSLNSKAKAWLTSLPAGTITTWNGLANVFLTKYFPPAKSAKMRNDISNFLQQDQESLYEAWERFKDLLRKCPHHGLPLWMQVQTFYNGLLSNTQTMVDAASGGAFFNKSPEEGYELIEVMASNNFMKSERNSQKRTAGVHDIDAFNKLAAQIALLNNNFKNLNVSSISNVVCDLCAGNHPSMECQGPYEANAEQVNFVANNQRQYNPNSNYYNQGWKNHPNFSWSNNVNVQQPIRNLEHQVGEISKLLAERTQGALPSNTEKNPREHVNAISLRSGKELDPPKQVGQQVSTVVQPIQGATSDLKNQSNDSISIPKSFPSSSTVPFPQRLRKQKLDNQFSKFLNIFKSLHINLPFVDMLEQMPKYAKFLKDILSNKRKLEECEAIALTEETTALLQKKLPPKLKDPGSFSIPCTIGENFHTKALCDLGASINLMPLSIFKKLGLGEPTPTMVSLVMADRSIKHPRGIVEDVLVKVGKLIFPVDFIVLDMEEDKDIPIILGRPFLATGGAIIDVRGGKLTLQVDDETVTFIVYGSMKLPQSAFGGEDMSEFNLYKQPP
ncbi:hypothetical protein UlMin_030434 [Ulmus minor]